MILDVAWNPCALLDACLMKLTFRDVMLILCLAARAHCGSPGRAEATWGGYHSHVAVCMQPLFSVFLHHCLMCTKCRFSYINVFLSGTNVPKMTLHVLVCDSVNYMQTLFQSNYLGKSHCSDIKWCIPNYSCNNFWLEYKLVFHPNPESVDSLSESGSERKMSTKETWLSFVRVWKWKSWKLQRELFFVWPVLLKKHCHSTLGGRQKSLARYSGVRGGGGLGVSSRPSWESAFFTVVLPFSRFSGGSNEHLGNPENRGKGLLPQISSD